MKIFRVTFIVLLTIIGCKEIKNENCFIYSTDIELNKQIESLINNDSLKAAEHLLRDRISTKEAKRIFHHNLGIVLFRMHDDTIEDYKSEILNHYYLADSLCPNSKVTIANLVNVHHHYHDYDQTIEHAENHLSLFQPDIKMYKILSFSYRELNEPLNSLDYAQKVIELDSACHYCYFLKADALNDLTEYNLAQESYEKALEFEPNDPYYIYGMGRLKYRMNDSKSALRYYLRALEIQPDDEMTLIILSRIYLDQNKKQLACEYLARAIDLKCQTCTIRQKVDYDDKLESLKKSCNL